MAKKAEMLKVISSANKRLQRLRSAGLENLDTYEQVLTEIARLEGRSPFEMTRKTIPGRKTMTAKEITPYYRLAKRVMKNPGLAVGKVKAEIKKAKRSLSDQKRIGTFGQKGINIRDPGKFFSLLKSSQFKKISEIFSSNQVIIAIREAYNGGASPSTLKRRMDRFLQSSEPKDDFYVEDLEDMFK